MVYIGVDLHRKKSQVAALDHDRFCRQTFRGWASTLPSSRRTHPRHSVLSGKGW